MHCLCCVLYHYIAFNPSHLLSKLSVLAPVASPTTNLDEIPTPLFRDGIECGCTY